MKSLYYSLFVTLLIFSTQHGTIFSSESTESIALEIPEDETGTTIRPCGHTAHRNYQNLACKECNTGLQAPSSILMSDGTEEEELLDDHYQSNGNTCKQRCRNCLRDPRIKEIKTACAVCGAIICVGACVAGVVMCPVIVQQPCTMQCLKAVFLCICCKK